MERLLQLQLQIQLQRGPTINNNPNLFVNPWKQQQQQGNVEESYGSFLLNPTKEEEAEEEQLRLPEQEEEWQQQSVVQFPLPSLLEDRMPFLQMLQSVESPTPFSSFTQPPHLQQLPSSTLQQPQKQWEERSYYNFTKEMELESCITHDICETKEEEEEDRDPNPTMEVVNSSACNYNGESSNAVQAEKEEEAAAEKSKKRKSSTTARGAKAKGRGSKKKKEEIENQRMTHIAVERNRRKQMNDHLHALRSLMPSCFVQRGDQASIIGGAIDFVKELEQHLQSLEAQKRMKMRSSSSSSCKSELELEEDDDDESSYNSRRDRKKGRAAFISNGFVTSSPSTTSSSMGMGQGIEIEVRVIESHVNLKIVSPRRGGGQLVRAIAALEDLRLAVLHLNVTSFDHSSVLFSFSLKMEEGCELGSGDEIAAAVCQIFSIINTTPPPTSNSNL